jgi:hypothetical protein
MTKEPGMTRRVLTAVFAIGLALGVAGSPAGARRDFETTHHDKDYKEAPAAPGDTKAEAPGEKKAGGKSLEGPGRALPCRYILGSPFKDGVEYDGLDKDTVPADGATVRPGQTIQVKLTWDADQFPFDELHGLVDCVTLDGELVPEASVGARAPENSGSFMHSYTVPVDAEPGSELCDQAMIAAHRSRESDLERIASNRACFTIARPVPAPTVTPPVTREPEEIQPEIVPVPSQQVLPAVETRPPAAPATLPRTGSSRLLLVLAGAILAAGGLAVAAGARACPLPVGSGGKR